MSNFNSSILLQEFNLKYANEDNITDSDEEVFELDSNLTNLPLGLVMY